MWIRCGMKLERRVVELSIGLLEGVWLHYPVIGFSGIAHWDLDRYRHCIHVVLTRTCYDTRF